MDPLPYVLYTKKVAFGQMTDEVASTEELQVLPVHPRSPPPLVSVDELLLGENINDSRDFFERPTEMLQDIEAWLAAYDSHNLPQDPNHVFIAILEIVSRDISTTLSLLADALSKISLGSMDDSQEQDRLALWQTLIRSYQADMPLMKQSLQEFVRWCFPDEAPSHVDSKLGDLTRQTDELIGQVEKAHKALRAEMSILESKRGIAEAEGVAKLTELAFVFIPLTFASSLFSMQVKELNDAMPTLSAFVGVCALFLGLSYGVRLAVRSPMVVDRKRELFRRIRTDEALASKQIPTRVFLSWTAKRLVLGKHIGGRWMAYFLFVSAILVPVVALIWTKSNIDRGLKVILTILMLSLAFSLGFYTIMQRFVVYLISRFSFQYFLGYIRRRRPARQTESSFGSSDSV